MAKIALEQAKEGMVLAKPVTRGDTDMVLVGEGTELTAGLLNTLNRMGIKTIQVKGEVPGTGGISNQERLDRLDHLFRGHGDDPWMGQVKQFLRQYFASRAAGSDGGQAGEAK